MTRTTTRRRSPVRRTWLARSGRRRYDGLNRQAKRIDPLNMANTYVYDIASRLTATIDRRGWQRDFQYDDLDRLTTQVWKTSGGTPVNTLVYSHDANDNLLQASNLHGLYSFTYDGLNRAATQRDVWALLLTFTYDKVDNRIKVEDSKGGVVSSIYDTLDRLQTRELTQYGANVLKVDLGYTPTDQLESVTRSRWNVSAYAVAGTTSYIYDALERMASLQHKDGGGGALAFYTYTYDLGSRVTSEKLNGVPLFTYTYDQTNQLTGDGTRGWGYDLIGNRNTTGYGHGPGNRLLTDSQGWSYKHDDEGNRTTKSLGLTTYTYLYGYDHNNQMVWAERRTAEMGGALLMRADYKYDAFGRRIEAAVDPDGDGPSGTYVTRFAWDGAEIWVDLDTSNNVLMRYVHGDMVDQLFARVDWAGTQQWYLTDRLGSVRQITTAAGAVQYTATYDPYGNVIGSIDDLFGRYRWTGRETDTETGLQYNRGRYYDPAVGRWTSEDPLGFSSGDPNLNRYVQNNPTNAVDPEGLKMYLVLVGDRVVPVDVPDTVKDPREYIYKRYGPGVLIHGLDDFREGVPRKINPALKPHLPQPQPLRERDPVLNPLTVMEGVAHAFGSAAYNLIEWPMEVVRMGGDLLRAAKFGIECACGMEPKEPEWRSRLAKNAPPIWDREASWEYFKEKQKENLINGAFWVAGHAIGKSISFWRQVRHTRELLDELAGLGVKHTPGDVIGIARDAIGRIVFLERGNKNSGLLHIIERHGVHFANRGIAEADIPDAIMKALTQGKVVGQVGSGRNLRNVYEVDYCGRKHRIAVGVADNGYIGTAHPGSF